MAIPRKGSRRIVVDGTQYLWRIRRKATPNQIDYGYGSLHVSIAAAHGKGATLAIVTDRPHPGDIFPRPVAPVTPADIRDWIGLGLASGWLPEQKGPTIFTDMRGGDLVRAHDRPGE